MLISHIITRMYWINSLCALALRRANEESTSSCDSAVLAHGENVGSYKEGRNYLARQSRDGHKRLIQIVADKRLQPKAINQLSECSVKDTSATSKFDFSLLAMCILLISGLSNFETITAQDVSSPIEAAGNTYLVALHTPSPIYPAKVATEGVFIIHSVYFTITKEGYVDQKSIFIEARNIGNEAEDSAFVEASISALSKFKFDPPYNSSGVNIEVRAVPIQFGYREGKVETFPFVAPPILNREYQPLNLITPHYPPRAKEEKIEGYVLVEFTVTTDGDAAGIVILDRQPSAVFNASAIEAAERFRFWPRVVEGVTVEAPGEQYTFNYELNDD